MKRARRARQSVGTRVRVRVNLECLYCCDPQFPACYERAVADDGRTGTVYDIGHEECSCRWDIKGETSPEHMAHDVWIKWDERRPYDDPEIHIGDWVCPFDAHFTASELEPLPPAVAPDPEPPGHQRDT